MGLPSIDHYISPAVFQINGVWVLVRGRWGDTGIPAGYTWNGNSWVYSPGFSSGLSPLSEGKPTIFQMTSGEYVLIMEHAYTGIYTGYTWTGSSWSNNASLVSGLEGLGTYTHPAAFVKDGENILIISQSNSSWTGHGSGMNFSFLGFKWNGTKWISDSSQVIGLGDTGYNMAMHTVFQKDGKWFLIGTRDMTVNYFGFESRNASDDIEVKIINIWDTNYPIILFNQTATLGQVVSADLDSSPISEPVPTLTSRPRNYDKSVVSRFKLSDTKVRILAYIAGGQNDPGSEGYIKITNPDWKITDILQLTTCTNTLYGTGVNVDKNNGIITWQYRSSGYMLFNENEFIAEFIVEKVNAAAVNLIKNPGFESGTTPWIFYASGGGTFTTPSPGYEGNKSAQLVLSNGGTNIQLYQTPVALEANTRYRLSFAAYSNTGHDMTVWLLKHVSPYTFYMPDFTVNLGTSWQTFSNEFNSTGFSGTVNDGRLMFWLTQYAAKGDNYYIDDVRLEKVNSQDTTPPMVTGDTPIGTNVPINTKITVTFSEAMNKTSAQSAFSTLPSTTGNYGWSGENLMTYTPVSSLAAGATYTVNIGTGAKDLADNSLQSLYSWQFTTASPSDMTPPTVIGSTPTGTNVPANTQITVTFSESMNQTSVQSAFSTMPSTNGSYSWNGYTMTYTPNANFAYNTIYSATIGTGAKDLAGNSLTSPFSWQFTTISAATLDERVAALEMRVAALEAALAKLTNP